MEVVGMERRIIVEVIAKSGNRYFWYTAVRNVNNRNK